MSGYRVGELHPSSLRQFTELDAGEVADLSEVVIRSLAVELRRRGIAGSHQVDDWQLAEQLRRTLERGHAEACRRAAGGGQR